MNRTELIAFLNQLRADRQSPLGHGECSGILQKFITPPSDFDECHVVTYDIQTGYTIQTLASKQQLWGSSIHIQRRCDLLNGYPEDILKVATKLRDQKLLLNAAKVIYQFLTQHVVNPEESDTRLVQVQRMVLVFKFDLKNRLQFVVCRQLSVISALQQDALPQSVSAAEPREIAGVDAVRVSSFEIDGGCDTAPVYHKLGQHFGVKSNAPGFSPLSNAPSESTRHPLPPQERRLLGVVAEASGYLSAELSTSALKGRPSNRKDPIEARRQLEELERASFLKERSLHKNDWREMFPKPGIVYSAAKADPDLRQAILGKLMAGDFPGMPIKEDLEKQQQQQVSQSPVHHASPSSLHRKSPAKKPRISRQKPSDTNVMASLDPPDSNFSSDLQHAAGAITEELPHVPAVEVNAVDSSSAVNESETVGNRAEAVDANVNAVNVQASQHSKAPPPNVQKLPVPRVDLRKPHPVRRPLNSSLAQPQPARHQHAIAPDPARLLR
jgi:hypothetical protein